MVGSNAHSFLARNLLELLPSPSRIWQDLVMNFSRRELAYPSDRLPRVSGLAQILQKRTCFEYVAGLWKETMVLGLLWSHSWEYYRTDDKALTGTNSEYHDLSIYLKAPSGSWASTTATVRFPSSTDDWLRGQCVTIKDVRCEIKGSNPFGEVTVSLLQIFRAFKTSEIWHWRSTKPKRLYNPYSTVRIR
jgi:hypothetical protein